MNSAAAAQPVPIVESAAVALPTVADSRLITLLMLDTNGRQDLVEVIEAQRHLPPGDVMTQWGQLAKRSNHVALILRFIRPTECEAIIEFDVIKNGVSIELILETKALQIQAGKAGDKIKNELHRPKMILEIPDTGFRSHWDKIHFNTIYKQVRSEGLNRTDARETARLHIEKVKEFSKAWSKAGMHSHDSK